jgi:hypothetical protein
MDRVAKSKANNSQLKPFGGAADYLKGAKTPF